jgi:hypothetical protein
VTAIRDLPQRYLHLPHHTTPLTSSSIASESVLNASEDPRTLMPEDTNPTQETPGASNSGSRRGRPSQTRNPNNRQSVHFVDPPPNPEPPSAVPSFGSQDPSQPSRLPSVLRPLAIPDPDPSASGTRQGPLTASNLPGTPAPYYFLIWGLSFMCAMSFLSRHY